jgi:hypothetical protein
MQAQPTIEILMIDDDEEQYKSLKNYAAIRHQVLLSYARTLEEGAELLRTNNRILGIILDGKGLIHSHSNAAEASEAFVHQAMEDIRVMEIKMDKKWPKCVLTAWFTQLQPILVKRGIRIFDKKTIASDEGAKNELFEYLLVQTKDSRDFIIRQKYATLFSWMDTDLMPDGCEHKLFTCIEALENICPEKSHLNTLRTLYEDVLTQMHKMDSEGLPKTLFHADGRVNLEWTLIYLSRRDVYDKNKKVIIPRSETSIPLPQHLIKTCYFLKDASSHFSHANNENISIYFYQAVLFAFCSLLEWYVAWAKKRKTFR